MKKAKIVAFRFMPSIQFCEQVERKNCNAVTVKSWLRKSFCPVSVAVTIILVQMNISVVPTTSFPYSSSASLCSTRVRIEMKQNIISDSYISNKVGLNIMQ